MSWLPWLLVLLGVVLLLVALVVWLRGQRTRRCIARLLAIPTHVHPLHWPEHARPALEQAGVVGLHWQGEWFGDAVQGHWGRPADERLPERVLSAGGDCHMRLRWAANRRTDEAHSLVLAVVDVFAQTWLSRMRERTQAVAVALAQRAHVHLYWQHDMRNLAQWVGLLAEEFGNATPEQLPRLAQRLQQQAPLALARAQKLLAATQTARPPSPPIQPPNSPTHGDIAEVLDAHVLLHNAARLAGLVVDVTARPATAAPGLEGATARALERTLDNIFSNIARDGATRQAGQALACDSWTEHSAWHGRLHTPRLSSPWPERPFEPLQSLQGSGLGLYQARLSLRDVGGDLHAQAQGDAIVFGWRVPLAGGCQIL